MAPQIWWKGYLKLSLVTCPVQMMPATSEGARVKFRTLNRRTGHPVVSRSVDAGTGAVVAGEEVVKGYPRGEGEYVMLEEEELDAVALESTRTIDIATFVDAGDVAWVWYDRPYYLTPSDPVGEEAFAVIRAAMEATGKAGISRLVMGGRERAVMLLAQAGGIVLWTLRYGDEVRDAGEFREKAGGGQTRQGGARSGLQADRGADGRLVARSGAGSGAGEPARDDRGAEEEEAGEGGEEGRGGRGGGQCGEHHGRAEAEPCGREEAVGRTIFLRKIWRLPVRRCAGGKGAGG